MRTITIEIPPSGIRLKLSASQHTTHRRAVLVLPDGIDAHLDADESKPETNGPRAKATPARPAPLPKKKPGKPMSTQEIGARLIKLKVRSETAAINAIKAMFQFTSPLTDQQAQTKLSAVRKAKLLEFDSNGKVLNRQG
ncbi:MAG TPA: hypothetical protein VFR78_00260 [Pyrinomonadaceae bacterium]|nr:hypothetical protein [Pyrinomonadaceae bacterium]